MGLVELEAAAALYTAARLEELRPFTIVDRILELWLARGLPVGAAGAGSRALDRYWLHRDDRLPEASRHAVYERVFGDGFDARWRALMAALAAGAGVAVEAPAQDVRDLLGARVDERALALAPLLIEQLRGALDVLDDREILDAHGARDMWQLVEARARLDLGVELDVARTQTMAAAGAAVIAWLAEDGGVVSEEAVDAAESWLAVAAAGLG